MLARFLKYIRAAGLDQLTKWVQKELTNIFPNQYEWEVNKLKWY